VANSKYLNKYQPVSPKRKSKRSRKPWAETRQAKTRFLIEIGMSKLNNRVINWGNRRKISLHRRLGRKRLNLEASRLGNRIKSREEIKNLKPRVKSMGISSKKAISLLVIMETFRLRVRRMTTKSIHRRNLLINKKIQ
jgi:hypothetical protein